MQDLEELLRQGVEWDLEGLVREANARLPRYLPEMGSRRVRGAVTPRLVRHYAGLGMLDEPIRRGKRALYTPRHLLQILVLRRLMAEGHAASALGDLVRQKSDQELLALLESGATLAPNPALGYLSELRERYSYSYMVPPTESSPSPPEREEIWHRLEVAPGLEVHVREDFRPPRTQSEMEALLEEVRRRLKGLAPRRSSSRSSRR